MAQQRLTESPEKMKQRIVWRESRPASAPSFPRGLHPLLQLQRTMGNRAVAARLERRPATKDERRAPVQRWPIWPPQPPKQPVDDYAGWAHPDFGRQYDLKNYYIDQDNRQHELTALLPSRSPRSISSTLRSTGRRLGSSSSIASVEMTSGRTGERCTMRSRPLAFLRPASRAPASSG